MMMVGRDLQFDMSMPDFLRDTRRGFAKGKKSSMLFIPHFHVSIIKELFASNGIGRFFLYSFYD